jgi:hypothetical protein
VTFFEESRWQPSATLSVYQVAYYRKVLTTHSTEPGNEKCRICDQTGCPDWRNAYDHMAAAGELMAEPEVWRRPTGSEAH